MNPFAQEFTWFEELTGFKEESPDQVRSLIVHEGRSLRSTLNNRSFICGTLETPSLLDLRTRSNIDQFPGKILVNELLGDVKNYHKNPKNQGALFQAASQFNLLEMASPQVRPEQGVGIYENDHTQGPACAISAGAGTIFRNYFAEADGQIGQTLHRQINCIKDLGLALGNEEDRLWHMQNGYVIMNNTETLKEVVQKIAQMNEAEKDALREKLRIGLQWDTQVTLKGCSHTLTQAYCSALPVAYNDYDDALWEPFARLVLEASYEATLHAALINYKNTGNPQVFLTFIGGGVFGNDENWIYESVERALQIFQDSPLHITFNSFSEHNPRVGEFIRQWSS